MAMRAEMLRPHRLLFCLAVFLLVLVGYGAWLNRLAIPANLRFVPPEAAGYLVSSSLGAFWNVLPPHLESFWQGSDTKLAKEFWKLREAFEDRCLGLYKADELLQVGLDPTQGIAIATAGSLDDSLLLVLPVANRTRLIAALKATKGKHLRVAEVNSARNPQRLRISQRTNGNGQLCWVADHTVTTIGTEPVELLVGESPIQLLFVPDATKDTTLQLCCTEFYADGSEGDCQELVDEEGHAGPWTFETYDKGAVPLTIEGQNYSGVKLGSGFRLVFANEETAILSNDERLLAAALRDPEGNYAYHQSQGVTGRIRLNPPTDEERPGASLFGLFRVGGVPGVRDVGVAVRFTPRALGIQSFVTLEPSGWTLIERLAGRTGTDFTVQMLFPEGSALSLGLLDPHLAYYLDTLFEEVPDTRKKLDNALGSFRTVLEQVAATPVAEGIGLYLLGVRDGVPQLAMAIRMPLSKDADELVYRVQRATRVTRDCEVLEGALNSYRSAAGTVSDAGLPDLLTPAAMMPPDRAWLAPEVDASWSDYHLVDDHIEPVAGAPNAAAFAGTGYRVPLGDGQASFLLPAFTDNDLRYRFDARQRKELDVPGLLSGHYRLAAAYDQQTRLLWIGVNMEMLRTLVENGLQREWSAAALRALKPVASSTSKLVLYLDPAWLLSQGVLFPNSDLQQSTKSWFGNDLAQYHSLAGAIYPGSNSDGLYISLRLERD